MVTTCIMCPQMDGDFPSGGSDGWWSAVKAVKADPPEIHSQVDYCAATPS